MPVQAKTPPLLPGLSPVCGKAIVARFDCACCGGRLPDDGDLCSQPTISRLENLPDARALFRMGRAMVDHYCQSFRQVPRSIVLDINDTFDAVHGGQ